MRATLFSCALLAIAAAGGATATPASSSYHGGASLDWALAVAVAPDGDVVIVGRADSADMPATPGAWSTVSRGERDMFIARFSADGTTLLAATYLGGSSRETAQAIAVDPASGDIIVLGTTLSDDMPVTPGAAQPQYGGGSCAGEGGPQPCSDGYVARLSGDLSTLRHATYFGSNLNDRAMALALYPGGDLIIGGQADGTLPGSAGAAQPARAGGSDGFVSRLSADLGTIRRTTYQGGRGYDDVFRFWIDPVSGDIVALGFTLSDDLADTAGALQSTSGGNGDAMLVRFDGTLTTRRQASYLGGSGDDLGNDLVFDPTSGGLLVIGDSASIDLPGAVPGEAGFAGGYDGFVTRIATSLRARGRTRYVGGSGIDGLYAAEVLGDQIVLAGATQSPSLPGVRGTAHGDSDQLVAYVAASLLGPVQGHRWGSPGYDLVSDSAQAGRGRLCLAGTAAGGVPMRGSAAQPVVAGSQDATFLCVDGAALARVFADGFEHD